MIHLLCCFLLSVTCQAAAAGHHSSEVVVPLPHGGWVGLSTKGPSAFRVRLLFQDQHRPPLESAFTAPHEEDAPSLSTTRAISSTFGSVSVSQDGRLELRSSSGALLTKTQPLGPTSCAALPRMRPVGGSRIALVTSPDEGACCDACSSTGGCMDWSFNTTQMEGNCWLGRAEGWRWAWGVNSGRAASVLSFRTNRGKLYGRGAGPSTALRLQGSWSTASVVNRGTYVPHFWSTDGYAALGTVGGSKHNTLPVWYSSDGRRLSWAFEGAFELYLMPATTLAAGTKAYLELVGPPPVPPLYAFGFMASRWGWKSREDIESTLASFRSGRFPLDAFILDFEWFANQSDYRVPPEGRHWYDDFGYHKALFPAPAQQMKDYQEDLHVRVGAIRKPRLGNPSYLETARQSGWMAPPGGPETYAEGRWISFTEPAMRRWYAEKNKHYLEHGMDFWWNDEGENQYYTYYWWNVAQLEMQRARASSQGEKRFFSLNRAFMPGLARLGATVWTGDVAATWLDLSKTPGMVLNWALAGAPYVACDIGGFHRETTPKLLSRWYQLGAFMPLMRVHSTLSVKPHWPWLFGEREAHVMRAALEMRYRLLPYHYSCAQAMYRSSELWMRPVSMDFPGDSTLADMTSQWMDGQILVAPVLREDSRKQVYLPKGDWYELGSSVLLQGPRHIDEHVGLEAVPAYAPAGAILPLATLVQHTGALPGGPLEVQVYAGADGHFELVTDDGQTVRYRQGAVHTTKLQWNDQARALSWQTEGDPSLQLYKEVFVTLFEPGETHRSPTLKLGAQGSISFPTATTSRSGQRETIKAKGRALGAADADVQMSAASSTSLAGCTLRLLALTAPLAASHFL